MKSVKIHRRTILRGLQAGGAALALPLLEAMHDGRGNWYGRAHAAGSPNRFVMFLFSNGVSAVSLNPWTPAGQGPDYSLSPALTPLGDMKDRVSVLTGLRHSMYFKSTGNFEHGKALSSLLAGVPSTAAGAQGQTMDQAIAEAWKGQTRFPSLQAVCNAANPPASNEAALKSLAWAGAGRPLPPVSDPAQLFTLLFGAAPGGMPGSAAPVVDSGRQYRYRKSILDYVRSDAQMLSASLGKEDRSRIDAFLGNIRTLENQIAPSGTAGAPGSNTQALATCGRPATPTAGLTAEPRIKAMVQLTSLALQCDLTRVVTLMFGLPFADPPFPWLPASSGGDHGLSHNAADSNYLPHVQYKVQTFASLLRLLDAAREGDKTILDSALVLGTSDVGVGSHDTSKQGVLLAGKAGGLIRSGQHVVYPQGTPLNRLLLTTLQLLKLPNTSFGEDGQQPLAGLA